MVWPSSIPSGIFTFNFIDFFTIPFPLQSEHGSFIILPVPLHCEHIFWVAICPNGVVAICLILPVPLHIEHFSAVVPFFAPLPLHVEHFSFLFILISFSTPRYASSKVISILIFKSAPLLTPFDDLLLVELPPKNDEKISPKSPKSPKSENPLNPEPYE